MFGVLSSTTLVHHGDCALGVGIPFKGIRVKRSTHRLLCITKYFTSLLHLCIFF